MSSKRTPSYRLHRQSGRAVVTLNGRDIYLGKYGSAASKKKYKQLLAEWTAGGAKISHGLESRATIAMLAADYLTHCEEYYPDTSNSEKVQIRLALGFL